MTDRGAEGTVGAVGVTYTIAAALVPNSFTARMRTAWLTLPASPVSTVDLAVPATRTGADHVSPASTVQSTTYAVIADPPVSEGLLHATVAPSICATALGNRGAEGAVIAVGVSVTVLLGALSPTELRALTRNVYATFPERLESNAETAVDTGSGITVHVLTVGVTYSIT